MSDHDDDHAAILELIHRNRIAIWMRDFEGWSECFVHEPYLTRFGWWRRGGVFNRRGWDEISGRLRRSPPACAHGSACCGGSGDWRDWPATKTSVGVPRGGTALPAFSPWRRGSRSSHVMALRPLPR